ncbi:hypothetical protein A3715_26870 [Oleiphilus sp. HI0009]|nr:hypothetical protein A3715_18175 [Oleiphilus sp. HI0009]KZX86368.1 hypothetical protein A3715_26870 [Oleiphilus sp. HI0009]
MANKSDYILGLDDIEDLMRGDCVLKGSDVHVRSENYVPGWGVPLSSHDFADSKTLAAAERRFSQTRAADYSEEREDQMRGQLDFFEVKVKKPVAHKEKVNLSQILESQSDWIKSEVSKSNSVSEAFGFSVTDPDGRKSFEACDSFEDLVDALQLLGRGRKHRSTMWHLPDGSLIRVTGCIYSDVWS